MSGLRAYIGDDLTNRGIRVVLIRDLEGGGRIIKTPGGVGRRFADDELAEPEIEPLRLDDDEARALLDALNRYYEGGEDTRSLRRDYDAERARVDRLITALIAPPPVSAGVGSKEQQK